MSVKPTVIAMRTLLEQSSRSCNLCCSLGFPLGNGCLLPLALDLSLSACTPVVSSWLSCASTASSVRYNHGHIMPAAAAALQAHAVCYQSLIGCHQRQSSEAGFAQEAWSQQALLLQAHGTAHPGQNEPGLNRPACSLASQVSYAANRSFIQENFGLQAQGLCCSCSDQLGKMRGALPVLPWQAEG